MAGSLSTHDIVMSQAGDGFLGIIPRWNLIVTGIVPFVIFLIAGTAELNRPPFDLVEAEQELVGGFHTEYSSIRFALFFLAEFMNVVTMSALIVTLFLGGPAGPVLIGPDWIWGPVWFLAKLLVFLFMFVWFRATLPRFRYDQLMDLGWKVLIPLALGWMLLLASLNIARDRGWSSALVVAVGFTAIVGSYLLLTGAMRTSGVVASSPTRRCTGDRPRPPRWRLAGRERRSRCLPPHQGASPAFVLILSLGVHGTPMHPAGERGRSLMGYLEGFAVTFRKLFKGTDTGRTVTVPYAKDSGPKRVKPDRIHGRHVLNRYEDGMEKCIGCELCAGVCPARCIYVRGADNPPDDPVSPGERYGFVYEINYLRCIHCDLCVEACPTEAITESKLFEFSFTNRQDAIYTKAELVVDDEGLPQQLPWEDWRDLDAVAAKSSAWVRATAPSGDADYIGKVAWSGELGFGVKPPEQGQTAPDPEPEAAEDDEHAHGHDDGGHHDGGHH
jgi:NADH-quinone oxidoreductase subunit I